MRIALVMFLVAAARGLEHLTVVHEWRTVDFEYPSSVARFDSIRRGEFVVGNAVLLDVDVWYNGKERTTFVTFPKFRSGIPASLGTVSDRVQGDANLIKPYPDWSWHTGNTCDGLISVFRTQIDKCGVMWVIDSGRVDLSLNTSRLLCPPKLVAFDLRTRRVACSFAFPDDVLMEGSLLVNLAVDVHGDADACDEAFVYVADVTAYGLIVYDRRRNRAWRIKSNTMYPYPPYAVFRANGAEFDLMDGILGMALDSYKAGDRKLYYHSLASVRESWVSTSVLRNGGNFENGVNAVPRSFDMSLEARKSQSVAEAFDKNGILYFGMMDDNSINCWNSETPFVSTNIHRLEQDDAALQFASGLKIIANDRGDEELWIVTDRFQLVMTDDMNGSDVNFRILRARIVDIARNSPCRQGNVLVFEGEKDTRTRRPYRSPPRRPHRKTSPRGSPPHFA